MHTTIARWGNSLALHVPEPLARQLPVSDRTAVKLLVQDCRLVLQHEREREQSRLVDLPGSIKPEDLPDGNFEDVWDEAKAITRLRRNALLADPIISEKSRLSLQQVSIGNLLSIREFK